MYPAYINSKKTLAEGRRIPKAKACEDPNYQEIRDVIAAAGFTVGVENKVYCREKSHEPTVRGRIRVHFKNDDGTLVNPKFPTRKLCFEPFFIYCWLDYLSTVNYYQQFRHCIWFQETPFCFIVEK